MTDSDRFEVIEDHLESVIDHCRDCGIIICDYQTEIPFQNKINELIDKMQDLDRMRMSLSDVMVPVEVFQKIDAGKNPQIFTRECMERALARNESVRGQLDTLKRFRQVLLSDLSKAFPNEMAKYRAWREAQDNRNAEQEPGSAGPASDSEFNMAANTPTGSFTGHG